MKVPTESLPTLCPRCGYDLRGHGDPTVCPECGDLVHVSAARAHAVRWVDMRLLDLWSIVVLHGVGTLAAVLTIAAGRSGQYVALLFGLAAGVYLAASVVWYVILLTMWLVRFRRPAAAMVDAGHRARLRWWLFATGLFIASGLAGITVLYAALNG